MFQCESFTNQCDLTYLCHASAHEKGVILPYDSVILPYDSVILPYDSVILPYDSVIVP